MLCYDRPPRLPVGHHPSRWWRGYGRPPPTLPLILLSTEGVRSSLCPGREAGLRTFLAWAAIAAGTGPLNTLSGQPWVVMMLLVVVVVVVVMLAVVAVVLVLVVMVVPGPVVVRAPLGGRLHPHRPGCFLLVLVVALVAHAARDSPCSASRGARPWSGRWRRPCCRRRAGPCSTCTS